MTGVSALALVLLMNIQDWLPLELTGLISLQSKGLSKSLSPTPQFKGITLWYLNLYNCTLRSVIGLKTQFLLHSFIHIFGMQDLSSPTRDQTHAPLQWKGEVNGWNSREVPLFLSMYLIHFYVFINTSSCLYQNWRHLLWLHLLVPKIPYFIAIKFYN